MTRGPDQTCSYLCGTAQRLRQPAAGFEELDEVIDDQLSLLVIPHHGHENLRRRMVTVRTKTDLTENRKKILTDNKLIVLTS